MKSLKYAFATILPTIITACGGGGGGTPNTADNPLKKYEGTYYVCDDHEKTILQVSPTNSAGLNVTLSAEFYSNTSCSGNIIGLYKWDSPALLTYTGGTSINLPKFTAFPPADSVDKIDLNISAMSASLTGSGVKGACVNYSNIDGGITTSGKHCYDLQINATSSSGALYLSNDSQYLIQFSSNKDGYLPQIITSRNPSFNSNSLVSRQGTTSPN